MDTFDLAAPELGAATERIQFVHWLVPVGANVIPGERVAELITSGVLILLEANREGTLVEQIACPGEQIFVGTVLGRICAPR